MEFGLSTRTLLTNTRFLPLSHDDCCVLPCPEKVRIRPSQTWLAFSAVEYQQEFSHGPLNNIWGKLFLSLLGTPFRLRIFRLHTYGLYEVRVSGDGNYQVYAIKRMQSNSIIH